MVNLQKAINAQHEINRKSALEDEFIDYYSRKLYDMLVKEGLNKLTFNIPLYEGDERFTLLCDGDHPYGNDIPVDKVGFMEGYGHADQLDQCDTVHIIEYLTGVHFNGMWACPNDE